VSIDWSRRPDHGHGTQVTLSGRRGHRASSGSHRSVRRLATLAVVVLGAVAGEGTAAAVAQTSLYNQASASGYPVGINIFDTVTLGGGVNPTGAITFALYGPNTTVCALPIFTTRTTVDGNGYYTSSRFTTKLAGTYRWIAVYGGDLRNVAASSVCSDPNAAVSVAKRATSLSASAGWTAPSTTETAVLRNGAGPSGPTGTMTYELYGPDDSTCARAPLYTTTRAVSGNGSYESEAYTVTTAGTYQWVAIYDGDANNVGAGSMCSETASGFIAPGTASSRTAYAETVVSASPTTVARGGRVTVSWTAIGTPTSTDWIGLYRTGTADGGAVVAWKYTTGTASGSVSVKFPWTATAGTYEVRLMAKNTTRRLATSAPITLVW